MRVLITALAFVGFCAALSWKASQHEEPEQRESIYARDGEDEAAARDRIERCTSSSFGFCHSFPR